MKKMLLLLTSLLLWTGSKPAGEHRLEWTAEDLTSGVYFLQLRVGEEVQIEKIVLQH